MEPPTQKDLLQMTPPDDGAWNLYKNGCTLGLNQVEQPGTSSRVGKYSPTNISELCAFIAAIRPGFKSMYKTFESREPFDYGVKAFDKLIQTEEMPNSYVLYQEHIMAALNYAGIPMSECYTVIKNIAKKRAEKVLAYKDTFVDGFSKKIMEEGVHEEEARNLSKKLWQIIEDSSSYSFNASHSYCVSLDSLYSAWIKAHHPLAFYETLLQIQEAKGDKDKMVEIKREAEDYFKIQFPPYKFGQDNREIRANMETNEITNSIAAIKGLPKTTGEFLWQVAEEHPTTMTDTLFLCKKHKVTDSAIDALAKIGYFSTFGNDVEVARIISMFRFYKEGSAKLIKKESVAEEGLKEILLRYAKYGSASSYTITNAEIEEYEKALKAAKKVCKQYTEGEIPEGLLQQVEDLEAQKEEIRKEWERKMLNEMEAYILSAHLPDLDYRNKIANQKDVLGYTDLTTGKEEDRRKLVIEDVFPVKKKADGTVWCYRVTTRSIGSGKYARLTVPVNTYEETPIKEGNVIFAPKGSLEKKKSGYWYLHWYDMLA